MTKPGVKCHRSCFGVYTSVGFEPSTVKNTGSLLLLSQTVKLSGWSHGPSHVLSYGPSHVLSHDWTHVPSSNHDSSPLMTCHVVSPLSFLSQPHFLLAATLSFSCLYPYHQPHFWLDATLSFGSPHLAPATLLTGPHTPLSFYIYPCHCQACTNMVCAPWSVCTLVAI